MFNPTDLISISGFHTAFKLTSDIKQISKGVAMLVMPSFMPYKVASSSNSRIVKGDSSYHYGPPRGSLIQDLNKPLFSQEITENFGQIFKTYSFATSNIGI